MRLVVLAVIVTCVASSHAFENLVGVLAEQNATTLLNLIDEAGLTDVLRTQGPFTVLVPTNAAFAKIPESDLDTLTQDQSALANLLKYHVINGEIFTWDLKAVAHLTSINGYHIRVYNQQDGLYFNQAFTVKEEIQASNGVVYLIEEVLNVPEGTILNILHNPDYNVSMFLSLVHEARLDSMFNATSGRFTVFAPSNDAFNSLPSTLLHNIQHNINYARIIVLYQTHIGTLHEASLSSNDGSVTTMNTGHYIKVTHDAGTGETMLNDLAHLIQTDIEADNGIVHVTSHVLIPSNLGLTGSVIG